MQFSTLHWAMPRANVHLLVQVICISQRRTDEIGELGLWTQCVSLVCTVECVIEKKFLDKIL